MKRAGVLTLLLALVAAGSASAGGPAVKNLPFKVAVPKHGTAMYAFKLTVKLPPGTTLSGGPPISTRAMNANKLAKNVLAASEVVKTGNKTWEVFIAVDARKASGSGASSLAGTIQVPPPLSSNPLTKEEQEGCEEYKMVTRDVGSDIGVLAAIFWIMSGPTHNGKPIVTGVGSNCP